MLVVLTHVPFFTRSTVTLSDDSKYFFYGKIAQFGPATCWFTKTTINHKRFLVNFTNNSEILLEFII